MACHNQTSQKSVKKQGEMPLSSLGPTLQKMLKFVDGMGLLNGISPCFFAFFEGWSMTGHS